MDIAELMISSFLAIAAQAAQQAQPPPPPRVTMEQSRAQVIKLGEAHCRRFPADIICHTKK